MRRAPHVVSEPFGPETVLLNPLTERYLRLNATGSALWAALESEVGVEVLAATLEAGWAVEPDRAHADAEAWVASLVAQGFVEPT